MSLLGFTRVAVSAVGWVTFVWSVFVVHVGTPGKLCLGLGLGLMVSGVVALCDAVLVVASGLLFVRRYEALLITSIPSAVGCGSAEWLLRGRCLSC
mgnify:CR=1 FL=1